MIPQPFQQQAEAIKAIYVSFVKTVNIALVLDLCKVVNIIIFIGDIWVKNSSFLLSDENQSQDVVISNTL